MLHGLTGIAEMCLLPLAAMAWDMYFSHFLPSRRHRINFTSFLRLTSVVVVVCAWSSVVSAVALALFNSAGLVAAVPLEAAYYGCYALPIALALKRPGPELDATCRFLVGIFYDVPLHFVVYAYAQMGWRLNALATPVMDGSILLGSLPYANDVIGMRARGITGVVNMCREWRGPVAAYEAVGIEQLRLPFADADMPTVEAAKEAIAFIQHHVRNGGRVLVHCRCGVGRSSTIVASYICHEFGLSAHDAVRHLRLARPEVSAGVANYPTVRLFGAGSSRHARGGGWAARADGSDADGLARLVQAAGALPPAPRRHYLGSAASTQRGASSARSRVSSR